jgi:hypothetical protein
MCIRFVNTTHYVRRTVGCRVGLTVIASAATAAGLRGSTAGMLNLSLVRAQWRARMFGLALLACCAACHVRAPDNLFVCVDDTDCPALQHCIARVCQYASALPGAAGTSAYGNPDAGPATPIGQQDHPVQQQSAGMNAATPTANAGNQAPLQPTANAGNQAPVAGTSAGMPGFFLHAGAGASAPSAGASAAGSGGRCTAQCHNGDECQLDTQCISGSCYVSKCRAPGQVNEPCADAADCLSVLTCSAGYCKKRDQNGGCALDSECASGSCWMSSCQQPQKASSPCDSNGDCVAPALCYNSVCALQIGVACGAHEECSTHYCNPSMRTCTTPSNLSNGDSCSADSQCTSGSCAWNDVCGSPVARLTNCNSDPDCMSGLMCYKSDASSDTGYCESSSNIDTRPTCKADSECSTGSCAWDDHCGERVGETYNCNSNPDCLAGLICGSGGYCIRAS